MVADVLSLQYQLKTHNPADGWQVIQQHAYLYVQDGKIMRMWLVCSGFHQDPMSTEMVESLPQSIQPARLGGTLFYDAGNKTCTEGPLEDIAHLMRQLNAGQTLEVHATNPSVARDLPAWCRLTGHELVNQESDQFLIRHK